MPCFPNREVQPEPDYSLPYPLVHKELDISPFMIKQPKVIVKENDRDYVPSEDDNLSSENTITSS